MHLLNTLPQRLDPGATPTFAGLIAPSLTSPASTNLTLGLGTGGTALTLADTTLAATFAGAVTVSGTTGQNIFVALGTDNNGDALAQIKSTGSTGSSQLGFSDTASVSGKLLYRHANDSLAIETGGAERARFTSTGLEVTGTLSTTGAATFGGAVTVSTGNLVIGTIGAGIDFSATAGTGTSELLNDYEEGTWTPSVAGSTTAGTVTYTDRYGYYTKIGRLLYVWFDVNVLSFSGGSGGLRITGFPFPSANITSFYPTFQPWVVAAAYASTYATPTGSLNPNTSVLILYSTDDGHANFDNMNVNQTGRIAGYVVMQTD